MGYMLTEVCECETATRTFAPGMPVRAWIAWLTWRRVDCPAAILGAALCLTDSHLLRVFLSIPDPQRHVLQPDRFHSPAPAYMGRAGQFRSTSQRSAFS